MVTLSTARKLATGLPEVFESKHFDTPDFRVKNKIFASLHEEKKLMMVRLSPVDQSVFCAFNKDWIYPVPGGWGKKGATFLNLRLINRSMFLDALTTAWKTVAPVKLVRAHFPTGEGYPK